MPTDDRLRQIMADLFFIEPEEIGDDASPDTIDNWDSLQHLNLIMSLEQEFGVRFSTDEISELVSFSSLLEAIEEHGARPGLGRRSGR